MDDTQQAVLDFLRKTIDPQVELTTPLLESGILDSFHVVELLGFVERQFDIRLEPTDVTQEDLASPQRIIELVTRLRSRNP